jgi:glutaredoxin-like protein NrdH
MKTITIYTTGPACMQCRLTTTALTTAGLGFEEIDVRQAPVVVVDDEDHWCGFQPDQIRRVATLLTRHT